MKLLIINNVAGQGMRIARKFPYDHVKLLHKPIFLTSEYEQQYSVEIKNNIDGLVKLVKNYLWADIILFNSPVGKLFLFFRLLQKICPREWIPYLGILPSILTFMSIDWEQHNLFDDSDCAMEILMHMNGFRPCGYIPTTDDYIRAIESFIGSFKSMRTLRLCEFGTETRFVATTGDKNSRREVTLSSYKDVTIDFIFSIFSRIMSLLTSIQKIDLSGCRAITDNGVRALASIKTSCRKTSVFESPKKVGASNHKRGRITAMVSLFENNAPAILANACRGLF